MKKHVLLIALAGLMMLAACNKDKESQGVAQFTATTEQQGGSARTMLNPDNGQILWTAGDQIVIGNDNNETAIFSLQSGEGTTEGSFGTSGEFNTVGPFIAAYPSTAEIEGDVVTFNLPATQTIGETGTFANGANPMVTCSNDKNLQFKNLCGGLGIRLKGVGAHVSAVRITSKNTEEKLWGAYEVSNCAADEPTLTVASGNQGTNVITLNCNVILTTAAKTLFVMLPPGTLANGFTMEVLDGNEVLATKETTTDIALVERNNVKCFNEILIDVEFDGNVVIPTGMSNTDIIITNFSEDAIPDENGDFAIGYSKMLMAKNADNGNIIYFSLNSIDENIRSEKSSGDDYEVNAKETAILFALRLLPFDMSHGDDEVLQRMKEIVYTLPCVQSLEDAVQNTVNNYGYLKEEGIADAVSMVADFFYEQLSAIEPESTSREIKNPQQEQLAAPQFNPNHKHGIELRIKDSQSQYHINPDRWTINCTGYSSLFCPVRIAAGYYDAMHEHFNESTPAHSYTMPPMSLSQYVKLAEKMSLLTMGGWAGWLELYRQMKLAMNDEEYLLQMTHVTLSNMTFELPRATNAIGIMTPKDDEHARVSAVLYMVLDVLTAISPVPVPVENLVNAYLLDGEFLNYCKSQPHSLEGIQNISQAMFDKLPDVFLTVGQELPLDIVNAFLKISNVCDGMDALISLLQSGSLSTFNLPVVAEYYDISFPTVHTSEISVTTTTATVSGSVEGGASAAIVERGFVYGDMANSESIVITVGSGTGSFETTIENLITGHQYYVMAYAKLTNGEMVYGEEKTFYLYEGDLTVYTFQPSVFPASPNVAAFYGAITGVPFNAPTIIAHGFSYGTEEDEQYTVINLGQGEIGEFVAFVEDLVPNTEYNVIAFATIYVSGNMITIYGDVLSFFTGNLPTVTTHEVLPANIGDTWATVTGSVFFPDLSQPIEYGRGFVIGDSPNGLTVFGENEVVPYNGTELLNFSYTFNDLWPNTLYYVRAYSYAEGNGVVYGNVVSFTTGGNLVYNGDFEQGNTGFVTDYIYGNTGSYNHYYVGHDIAEMWSWDSPGFPVLDHTSGAGLFLMIDGSSTPNTTAWSQTVTVSPNTNYVFSAWFLTNNIGYVKFEINGVSGEDFTTPVERWVWERHSMEWNSGNNTEVIIKIINRYSYPAGYDYCIDDISFTPVQTPNN